MYKFRWLDFNEQTQFCSRKILVVILLKFKLTNSNFCLMSFKMYCCWANWLSIKKGDEELEDEGRKNLKLHQNEARLAKIVPDRDNFELDSSLSEILNLSCRSTVSISVWPLKCHSSKLSGTKKSLSGTPLELNVPVWDSDGPTASVSVYSHDLISSHRTVLANLGMKKRRNKS